MSLTRPDDTLWHPKRQPWAEFNPHSLSSGTKNASNSFRGEPNAAFLKQNKWQVLLLEMSAISESINLSLCAKYLTSPTYFPVRSAGFMSELNNSCVRRKLLGWKWWMFLCSRRAQSSSNYFYFPFHASPRTEKRVEEVVKPPSDRVWWTFNCTKRLIYQSNEI